jgi:lipopolysaccharide assembly protein A
MKHVKAFISLILMLFAVIIIVENLEQLSRALTLKIDLLFWAVESPPMAFYFVLIIVFLFGILIAGLFGIVERFKLKKQIRDLLKENKGRDKELDSLRNLPIVQSTADEKKPEEIDER